MREIIDHKGKIEARRGIIEYSICRWEVCTIGARLCSVRAIIEATKGTDFMNIKLRKSRRFELALLALFASAFGGCATRQTPMQTAEAQVAQPVKTQVVKHQPVKAHLMRLVVQKPNVRQVYKGVVAALTFSPDSKTLASAGGSAENPAYPSMPGGLLKIEVLDAQTLRSVRTLPLLPATWNVVFSPDLNRAVISPLALHGLQLLDARNGKSLWQHHTQLPDYPAYYSASFVNTLAISLRGDKVLSCFGASASTGWTRWWSVGKQSLEMKTAAIAECSTVVTSAAFSPNSQSFVVGGVDNTLALYDTKSCKTIWTQNKYETRYYRRMIRTIAFSPDSKTIATGNVDKSVSLWNAQNGQLLRTLKVHSKPVQVVVFSPDSIMLASGSDDGAVVLSSTGNGATLHVSSSRKAVTALAFAPDGKHLAAGYADGKIALWRVR